MSLQKRVEALNSFTENVENWFICLGGKVYHPPSFQKSPKNFFFKHENVIVAAQVEMYGFEKVQKVATVGSDKYRLTEIPENIMEAILDGMFSDGVNHTIPKIFLLDKHSKIPKIRLVARWEPPGTYVKDLLEKRNFVTAEEFEKIRPYFDDVYDHFGVKIPNFIRKDPVVSVPGSGAAH